MRPLRAVAAALLLFPSAQTARAAASVRLQNARPIPVLAAAAPLAPARLMRAPGGPVPSQDPAAAPSALVQAQSVLAPEIAHPDASGLDAAADAAAAAYDGSAAKPAPAAPVPAESALAARATISTLPPLAKPFRARVPNALAPALGSVGLIATVEAGLPALFATAALGMFMGLAVSGAALLVARRIKDRPIPERASELPLSEQNALRARATMILQALTERLGHGEASTPALVLSNAYGADNAWANGSKIDSRARVGLGDAYAALGDRDLAATLAHEMGHLRFGDTSVGWSHLDGALLLGKRVAAWAGIGLTASALSAVLGADGRPGVAAASFAAALVMSTAGPALMAAAGRLIEHRADAFGAWLVSGSWLADDFERMGDSARAAGIKGALARVYADHPSMASRIRRLRARL